ncbi:unnamed protein product, partial [Brenthis ino]
MVSPVKNQIDCNACWAFSAVANIESHLKIHLGRVETLSEQFLINCDGGEAGCGPQSLLLTFARIVVQLGGVLRNEDYEQYAGQLKPCYWNGSPKPVPVIGFRRVPSNEDAIATYIYKYGPVSAGINSASMAKYDGGIDEPTDEICDPNDLNHAILIVGFGSYDCQILASDPRPKHDHRQQLLEFSVLKYSVAACWEVGNVYTDRVELSPHRNIRVKGTEYICVPHAID